MGLFTNLWILFTKLSYFNIIIQVSSQGILCEFNLSENNIVWREKSIRESTVAPRLIWSHLDQMGSQLYREINEPRNPIYPTNIIAIFQKVQVNFQAGAIFDENACLASFSKDSYEWNKRKQYFRKQPAYLLTKDTRYEFDEVIFLWGSQFVNDFQHSIIDFLPLFDIALPFLISHPNLPIIVGRYIQFFQDMYPFNLFTYIQRDFRYKHGGGGIPDPITIRTLYYVDIIHREQSYLLPGTYDRLLPFLTDTFQYNPAIHNLEFLKNHLLTYASPTLSPTENKRRFHKLYDFFGLNHSNPYHNHMKETPSVTKDANLVVYLDRSALLHDDKYIQKVGKVNGRLVYNQSLLLEAINASLLPPYQLVVHSSTNWRNDRQIMKQAKVIIGSHGGHFSNGIFAPPGTHLIEMGRSWLIRLLNQPDVVNNNQFDRKKKSRNHRKRRETFRSDANDVNRRKKSKVSIGSSRQLMSFDSSDSLFRKIANSRFRASSSSSSSLVGNQSDSLRIYHNPLYNPRLVFVGLSNAMGHHHWMIEDLVAVYQYVHSQRIPTWSDDNIRVNVSQVIDTLIEIKVCQRR